MAYECRNVSQIVSTFLLNTCRLGLPPRLSHHHDVQAVTCCAFIAGDRPVGDEEAEVIPLVTGSIAEFYIEPMLPHIGDIDVMFYNNTELAIPRGHPPPTQLPAEFRNYVRVLTVTYLAMSTCRYVTYLHNVLMVTNTITLRTKMENISQMISLKMSM